MRPILIFEVYDTLLNVGSLEPLLAHWFVDRAVLCDWFSTALHSHVSGLDWPDADLSAVAAAALDMLTEDRHLSLSPEDRRRILSAVRTLPVHADAPVGLRRLCDAGFRAMVVANSSPAAIEEQLARVGLASSFERAISIGAGRPFTPAEERYRAIARRLRLECNALRVVSAHAEDIVGALRAGCAGAFVARVGHVPHPLTPQPDVVADDLEDVADQIIARDAEDGRL